MANDSIPEIDAEIARVIGADDVTARHPTMLSQELQGKVKRKETSEFLIVASIPTINNMHVARRVQQLMQGKYLTF